MSVHRLSDHLASVFLRTVETVARQFGLPKLASPHLLPILEQSVRTSETYSTFDHLSTRMWGLDESGSLKSITKFASYDTENSGALERTFFWVADDLITLDRLHADWGYHTLFCAGHAPYGPHLSVTQCNPPPDLFGWCFPDCPDVLVVAGRPVGESSVRVIMLHAAESAGKWGSGDLIEHSRSIGLYLPTFSYSPPNPPWYPKANPEEEIAARKAWVVQRAADFLSESFAKHQADFLHLIPFRGKYHTLWRRHRRVVEEVGEAPFLLGNYLDRKELANQKGFLTAVLEQTGLSSEFAILPGMHGTRFVIAANGALSSEFMQASQPQGEPAEWVTSALRNPPMMIETSDFPGVTRFSALAWNAGLTVVVVSDTQPIRGTEDAHCILPSSPGDYDQSLEQVAMQYDFDVIVRFAGKDETGVCLDRNDPELAELFCVDCQQLFVAKNETATSACPLCSGSGYPTIRETRIIDSDYFILSETGMPERMFLLSQKPWYFDNGRDVAIYDRSPLRKDAIRLNDDAAHLVERTQWR